MKRYFNPSPLRGSQQSDPLLIYRPSSTNTQRFYRFTIKSARIRYGEYQKHECYIRILRKKNGCFRVLSRKFIFKVKTMREIIFGNGLFEAAGTWYEFVFFFHFNTLMAFIPAAVSINCCVDNSAACRRSQD